ncbi:MAG TPA: hypothetical protein VLZ11_06270 [Flavobacterium sp.]|nr:hypothetical protein [Flavobacterium sp.]
MKMTNKWVAIVLLVTGTLFTACSKDDNKSEVDPLVGEWKAEILSYTMGGHTGTHPFDHEYFKQGCGTDYITLTSAKTVSLTENNKEGELCVDEVFAGTWNDQQITVKGAVREIISVNASKLVLIYDLDYSGQTLPVTVEYSRQLAQ